MRQMVYTSSCRCNRLLTRPVNDCISTTSRILIAGSLKKPSLRSTMASKRSTEVVLIEEEQRGKRDIACNAVRKNAYLMQQSLNSKNLNAALGHASTMINELRTAELLPKTYYELWADVTEQLSHLETYIYNEYSSTDTTTANVWLSKLYDRVQYSPRVVSRLYLLITVASVCLRVHAKDQEEIIRILVDLGQLTKAVQHPTRGFYLRHHLSQISRRFIPDVPKTVQAVSLDDHPIIKNAIDFVVFNFKEMTKLWIRMQYQGRIRNRNARQAHRWELRKLVVANLRTLSKLNAVSKRIYGNYVFEKVTEVLTCRGFKDRIAHEYLMECLIVEFSDEYHLHTLEGLISVVNKLQSSVNVNSIIIKLLERLSIKYAECAENRETFLNHCKRIKHKRYDHDVIALFLQLVGHPGKDEMLSVMGRYCADGGKLVPITGLSYMYRVLVSPTLPTDEDHNLLIFTLNAWLPKASQHEHKIYIRYPKHPTKWTVYEVAKWIGGLEDGKYARYKDKCVEKELDGEDLVYLDKAMLKNDYGIGKPAHRSVIIESIRQLISTYDEDDEHNEDKKTYIYNVPPSCNNVCMVAHKVERKQAQDVGRLTDRDNALVICVAIAKYDTLKYLNTANDIVMYRILFEDKYHYKVLANDPSQRMDKKAIEEFLYQARNELYDFIARKLNYDSLIVTFGGHGTYDSIICSDGTKYKHKDLRKIFLIEECKDIPKIFLIDACRTDDDNDDQPQAPHRSHTAATLSSTLMTRLGSQVYGAQICKFITKGLSESYANSEYTDFRTVYLAAKRKIKEATKAEQDLQLCEHDTDIDSVIFRPKGADSARGTKAKRIYADTRQRSTANFVHTFLKRIGMECYYDEFKTIGWVDETSLKGVNDQKLESLGIRNESNRKAIMKAVKNLK
eukprot:133040_1